jgi:hypothetical protein
MSTAVGCTAEQLRKAVLDDDTKLPSSITDDRSAAG